MKNYLILFREPDGRMDDHPKEETTSHQQKWAAWLEKWGKAGNLAGGNSLTLDGRIIKGKEPRITNGMHQVGTEIVGGFLLLKAQSLDEATEIAASCPIYEFDGYAEVRELRNQ